MMRKARSLVSRAHEILRTEGLTTLLKRSFEYSFFGLTDYDLYELPIAEAPRTTNLPDIEGLGCHTVRSRREAEELRTSTGLDLCRRVPNAERILDAGAVAICVSVNGNIAHIGWVALSERARNAVSPLRLKVEFSRGQAFAGGGVTLPDFRRNGLLGYGSAARLRFLEEMGCRKLRYAVATNNTAAQKGLAVFSPTVYARGRHLKLLWWDYWRETPLVQR